MGSGEAGHHRFCNGSQRPGVCAGEPERRRTCSGAPHCRVLLSDDMFNLFCAICEHNPWLPAFGRPRFGQLARQATFRHGILTQRLDGIASLLHKITQNYRVKLLQVRAGGRGGGSRCPLDASFFLTSGIGHFRSITRQRVLQCGLEVGQTPTHTLLGPACLGPGGICFCLSRCMRFSPYAFVATAACVKYGLVSGAELYTARR